MRAESRNRKIGVKNIDNVIGRIININKLDCVFVQVKKKKVLVVSYWYLIYRKGIDLKKMINGTLQELRKNMKKIYAYYTLFFTGSILPFLIVACYFQDVFTMGILSGLAGVVLAVCITAHYIDEKIVHQFNMQNKKIKNIVMTQTKPEIGGFSYFFRNIL